MLEKIVDIKTPDGILNSYAYYPDEGGPFPVVVYYHDAAGAREAHADACRRIAAAGYYVLMPNLYYRQFRCIDIDVDRFSDPAYADKTALMFSLSTDLSVSMVMRDTKAVLAFLDTETHARRGKIGLLGYCMSGRFVYRGAGEFSERVASAISMYGNRLVDDAPDSPHLLTHQIKGEMYFGFA
jgi:carboxymethylenebutenolidase